MSSLFILAGEASGDLHGSHLVAALKSQQPDLHIFGVAGPKMIAQGVETVMPMEDLQLMGFTAILFHLAKMRRLFNSLLATILERNPDHVVLIDYAGLNLRLAAALRRRGYQGKIVQYICPKVWAWGKKRIPKMVANLDLVLAIFPFEVPFFDGTGLNIKYIGNPLVEEIASFPYEPLSEAGVIGLFPGSRPSEIDQNLPNILQTALLLKEEQPNLTFCLSIASKRVEPLIMRHVARSKLQLGVDLLFSPPGRNYDLMRASHAAIATSGTVNLELALHEVPTVVVYRLSHINAALARLVFGINLTHYSIANIVAEKSLFPELIYVDFTPKKCARALRPFLSDSLGRQRCLNGCAEVGASLATTCPSEKAAKLIFNL